MRSRRFLRLATPNARARPTFARAGTSNDIAFRIQTHAFHPALDSTMVGRESVQYGVLADLRVALDRIGAQFTARPFG
jgi:hypothetical protein